MGCLTAYLAVFKDPVPSADMILMYWLFSLQSSLFQCLIRYFTGSVRIFKEVWRSFGCLVLLSNQYKDPRPVLIL